MNKGEQKRQVIFDRFVKNRNSLIDNGFIIGEKDVYLCPICKGVYHSINGDNPLTLEDAPPKSLGGKANVLTCKKCNNIAGTKMDSYLVNRLKDLSNQSLPKGKEIPIEMIFNDDIFKGTFKINNDGSAEVKSSCKNNNKLRLDEKMKKIKEGDMYKIKLIENRIDFNKVKYALLKTAYIMAFEKFGDLLLFDSNFDVVREQLLNPEKRIYPQDFCFASPYEDKIDGVNIIMTEGIESILVQFELKYEDINRRLIVFLPCMINDIFSITREISTKKQKKVYNISNNNAGYVNNIDEVKLLYNWIKRRKKIK